MFHKRQLKVKDQLINEKTQEINFLESILKRYEVGHVELAEIKKEMRACL